ncbi:right-handed parallel beta-helix repeat-containing protein [Amycolatopsis nigrescens]|uniref:right-handed parallel beta-helix repeat-containing protein n=1 Tax=Amycolatopsis nigrescens TaxID=381445 RepID=UPI00039D4E57|nr:right-handed parallel beta-helix repeat-containing protein [Amycolatopsis nigrescens]
MPADRPRPRPGGHRGLGYGVLAVFFACLLVLGLVDSGGAEHDNAAPGAAPEVAAGPPPAPPGTGYPVPADSLFVAENGNDSAAGTEKAPLHSITAAVQRAPGGATIVVRAGTYRETVGMVRKRVTIQPYPGEQVWAKGSLVVTGWTRDGARWRHDGWDPQLCRNCFLPEIIDPAHPLAGQPDMAFLDGVPLRQVGSEDDVRPGTFFVDVPGKALVIGDDPGGRTVEATALDRFLQFDKEGAAGSVLRGIGVAEYGSNQNYGVRGAMVVVNAPGVVVENTVFARSASTGLAVYQPGASVRGSTLTGNGLAGLSANRADGLRLEHNTFSANNAERFSLSGEAIGSAGAKITRSRHLFVADNVFAGNLATGWWCDLGCIDATVIRNVAEGNSVNGLYYEVSSRALVASNLMVGNGQRGLKISSSDGVRVYNNTFSANKLSLGVYNDERDPSFDSFSEENRLTWVTAGTELVNNYFAQPGGQPVTEAGDYKDDPAGNPPMIALSDANAYLAEGPLAWSSGAGKTRKFASLGELRAGTGQEQHGIEVPAGTSPFRNPGGGDYTLKPGAPGVAAGRPLPADVRAAIGASSKVDIGALPTS